MLYSVVAADAGVTYSDLTVSLTLRLQLQVLKGLFIYFISLLNIILYYT